MSPETISNITWARCGIVSLVGVIYCPCSEPSEYRIVKGQIVWELSMEGLAVIPLTLRSIEDHDVLLDTAHNLLNSIVESNCQHNLKPNGSHTWKSVGLI